MKLPTSEKKPSSAMNENWRVYKHQSPSGKVYIGITSQAPHKRWGNGSNYRAHRYLYAAIKKYGWDNFKHEILFENLSESEAKQKEIELIASHKSNIAAFGYNLTDGGDGITGYTHTEETRRKIGEALRERFSDPAYRNKVSASRKGTNNPLYGKQLTKEHREKLSVAHLGKKRNPHTEETKAKISMANMGKKKPHIGVPRSAECMAKIVAKIQKPVLQYTKSGDFVAEYKSGAEASKATGIASQGISKACRTQRTSAGGYVWKFKNN